MKRGSLLSQPQSVLQKLASISEGNPLAPRNSKGFLFHTLSPEKDGAASGAPQKQVHEPLSCMGRSTSDVEMVGRHLETRVWRAARFGH